MTDPHNDHSPDENNHRSQEDVYREIHEWTSSGSLSETMLTAIGDLRMLSQPS